MIPEYVIEWLFFYFLFFIFFLLDNQLISVAAFFGFGGDVERCLLVIR